MRILFLMAIIVSLLGVAARADEHEEGISLHPADKIVWKAGPPSLPKGAQIAVLEGDPSKEGPFVFRVKAPDGYRIPPHTHPKMERVTVISGTFNIGMGEKFDQSKTTAMPAGTYGFWEPGMKHFVWTKGETIAQFHGMGPWKIEYVNPADDPRNAAKATFRGTIEFTGDSLEVVKKKVASGEAVLVDVRSQEEWNKGHIDGSIFVPETSLQKHSFDAEKLAKLLPKKDGQVVYTYCVVGMRAKQAGIALEKQGYAVQPLKPGYEELLKAGFKKADAK